MLLSFLDNIPCLWFKAQKPSDPLLGKKFHPKWKSLLTFPLVPCHPVHAFVPCCVVTMVPGRGFMVNETKVLMSGGSLKLQGTHKVFPLRELHLPQRRSRSPKFIHLFRFFHLFLKLVQLKLDPCACSVLEKDEFNTLIIKKVHTRCVSKVRILHTTKVEVIKTSIKLFFKPVTDFILGQTIVLGHQLCA